MTPTPVTLRVYDLSRGLARQLSPALLGKQIDGIWHTGVLVHGREFFFGGGIQVMAPELVVARYGMEPVETLALGTTSVSLAELEAHVRAMSPRFTAATYDLLRHNCNNFSDELVRFLLGGARGIPAHILDLPREALSTPLGAMLRPMLENMQREMHDGGAMPGFAIPFNDPTRAHAPVATESPPLLSRRLAVSGRPTLHLTRFLDRIEAVHGGRLSPEQVTALRELGRHVIDTPIDRTTTTAAAPGRVLEWWRILAALLDLGPRAPAFFPALGVFRVLLLVPVSEEPELLALKNACFDRVLGAPDELTHAQKVLVLAVLVNGFVNAVASELVLARALRLLPFVFGVLTAPDADGDVRVLGATLIRNCCLALRLEAEEAVITTLICGCLEVLERVEHQSQPDDPAKALEGVLAGLGRLLHSFAAARSLSVELGLAEVLRRLHGAPRLSPIRPLLAEVVALI